MIKKLISSLLIAVSVMTVIPIGASAEWRNDNTGWWYTEEDGYSTGWKQIDGAWYYFDSNGYMKTGWLKDNGKWYYLFSSGIMKTGWVQEDSTWYYLDDNGVMVTGKVSVNNEIYEFDNTGKWIDTTTSSTSANTSASVKPSLEKLKTTADYNWFEENGNTYFKVKSDDYTTGVWNIDGNTYLFDNNGVLQKGEFTADDGFKYLFGNDGKYIKCLNKDNFKLYTGYAITTKSGTNNPSVKVNNNHLMDITDIYSPDSQKDGIRKKVKMGTYLDKTKIQPATIEGSTLKCKTNQTIVLGVSEAMSADSSVSGVPNLFITSKTSDQDVAFLGIDLGQVDGYMANIIPTIIAKKPGETTITINVNGTEYSFNVIVSE